MKEFFKRAVIFAIINAVLIGTCFLFNRNAKLPDYNIIYGTLVSLLLGFPYEIVAAKRAGRRPVLSEFWGAAIFGSIVMAAIVFIVLYACGVIV